MGKLKELDTERQEREEAKASPLRWRWVALKSTRMIVDVFELDAIFCKDGKPNSSNAHVLSRAAHWVKQGYTVEIQRVTEGWSNGNG